MDPIAHTLFGAGMAQTGLARRTRLGTATLLLGANLPDIDVLAYVWGSDAALAHRRGWTHGVLAMAVLPLLLVALALLVDRWRPLSGKQRALAPRWLLLLACLSVWSHPLLDWLNTYGVRLLMPFDGRWLYGDSLFIVDPWLWLVLGGMLFVVERRRVVSVLLVLLALSSSLLLFGSPLAPVASRIAWLAGILAVIVIRRAGRFSEVGCRRFARLAFVLTLGYIFLMLGGALLARRLVAGELRRGGMDVQSLMVGPLPADPLHREVVAATPDEIRVGSFGWLDSPRLQMEEVSFPRPPRSAVVQAAWQSSCVRGLVSWARFPFVEVEQRARGWEVFILDARYTRRRTRGFGGGLVVLDEELRARCPSTAEGDAAR